MNEPREPVGAWYRSAVDPWLGGAIGVTYGIGLYAAVDLFRAGAAGDRLAAVFTLAVLAAVAAVIVPLRYRVTAEELLVQSGIIRIRIPLASIERVSPTRSVLASPALSMKRLAIEHRPGRFGKPVLTISPVRRESFLSELARAAGLEREADRLVRTREPSSGRLPHPSPLQRRSTHGSGRLFDQPGRT